MSTRAQSRSIAVDAADRMPELRVCHVMSADLWAGAEVQVATLLSYLIQRPEMSLTAVLFNEGWLAEELRRLGVEVAVVDEKRHTAFQILTFLTRFLEDHEVRIVHTHGYKDNILGSAAAKLAGVPHVIRTVHGLSEPMRGWDWAKFRAYDALDKLALWFCADRILAVSKRTATIIERSGCKARAVISIHNGVDLRKVNATLAPRDVRRMLGISPDEIVIGTAGRLSPVKGHTYLVRAAGLILQREPRARFLFVGSGPLEGELLSHAAALGVDRACTFVDPSLDRRAGVYDLMAAMDVFVLPSLDEGIPMALLEAMGLGRPVVATSVGGVPEVITNRATGLLVRPRNERELADACLELAANRYWAQTVGARGRRLVETAFSHERNGRALLDVYRQVTGGRHGGTVARTSFGAAARKCLRSVGRTLDHAVERRSMRHIRRNPAALCAVLKSATRILIVCHGNIIRSPFAARLMAQALGGRTKVSVASAGLQARPGTAAHPTAVLIATALGVDLRDHTAARVARHAVESADVIFVMDIPQLIEMRQRFPHARAKVFLLTCLAQGEPLEVHDPVFGDEAVFRASYDHIVRVIGPIVRALEAGVPRAVHNYASGE